MLDLTDKGMCNSYDPRFKDWYTSAATGPKDIVIVLDKSGSMGSGDPPRISLAYDAAMAIIDTFGAFDFVGIVLFDHQVYAYSDTLLPATSANKERLRQYLNDNFKDNNNGGTNFRDSIRKAFDVLKVSANTASCTARCNLKEKE